MIRVSSSPEAESGFGFDAVWADDFHHIVRVANTHEDEGYLGDFSGSVGETVDALNNGWLYRGQSAKSTGRARGTECRQVPPERFIHCISNHDQTGNHAFGERLAHRIFPKALRAAETLLCLSPYTPMLFMGQEWATTTPFLFFTDHNAELGKLILAGRRAEFSQFAAFRDPAMLEKIPDPQKLDTFAASKLVWEEAERGRHAGIMALYKECLALRASEAAFRPLGRDSWRAAALACGIGALRLDSKTADWLVLFDLHGGHQGSLEKEPIFETGAGEWRVVMSSNEARFGGTGTCAVDLLTMRAAFWTAETVVLRASHL